ncbi:hypothetical protein PJK45_02130 [Mycobacterium kansasii]|uniref:Uncharacterized protein n=3 Tax=Mycobacterium kansasii TaxID=1768 RepID=A0A1V3WZH7_MYCKA|nr:hypothetical protein [Mycobacterium kansasii]EUA00520.1 hypothetical protein I547_4724 [Mycobacterium kansasii 824]AGZ49455.1 hypothetical protein MKAN_03455 [Mycobacterium kansasii ATCC 12478]ARG58606.1 hypothetical protein B1T43_25510 [Mycobacterium kansasii]ARG64121.1 hypothetical protein B1T45_26065 [Mycobacterium kansasii]ARG71774.1 hypothetical protein B1T47_25445 [Mycobacterium kansasii]
MTAHDEQAAGRSDHRQRAGSSSDGGKPDTSEVPEPSDEAKETAAEMMTAYEDRPTLVLPGSGKTITGTAVGDWLDEHGHPRYADDTDSPAAKAKADNDETDEDKQVAENLDKDKAYNEEVLKSARDETAAG